MIKRISLLILIACTACQSIKIKNDTYQLASSSPELGSIGHSNKKNVVVNNFDVRTLPKLENKIRITIDIVPFDRKLNKAYQSKKKYNQEHAPITYVDSLPVKPELATLKILDINGLVHELNANYNANVVRLLKDTKNFKMVTSLAVSLSADEITKIRQADAYYLAPAQDSKYIVSLYKSGQKTDVLSIKPEAILAFQTSTFCWAMNQKKEWYIADIISGTNNCKGNTQSNIPNRIKKNTSLFDM